MRDMKYLDFDLAIEPSGNGYTARVFNSPCGQASAEFTTPFSDLEVENFLLRVGRTRHTVRRVESPEMASAKAFGAQLFNGVFTGEVRGCLRSSVDEASRQAAGLRVRLHLGKAPALADLPWEFLYNASMNRFLSLSIETPLVRYLDLQERIRPLAVKPPLRVLMMISSPTDYPSLDVDRESAKMTEALASLEARGLVIVERQEEATLSELQRRLRQGQYHIFHFIGHGGFDSQADDGILVLTDPEGRGRRVSAQFLGTLLHDHRPLRLAILNACEGARASRLDPFAGTAQSLVQQGIPAVIAMQFEVTDDAAICFTREFYAAIASGYPVDAAMAESRKAIFAEVSEIEWGTPVLYMRSPDGRIFEVEQISEPDRQQLQISSLLSAAQTAAASGDDAGELDALNKVLVTDPKHAAASVRVQELNRRRTAAERAKAVADEDRARRTAALRDEAWAAMDDARWVEAVHELEGLVAIEPEDALARAQLTESRRQRDLASQYKQGRLYYELRQWPQALAELRELHQKAPRYRDIGSLIATAERELKRGVTPDEERARVKEARSAEKPQPARSSVVSNPAVTETETQSRKPVKYFMMGGMLGAVLVVGALLLGILAAAYMAGRSDSGSVSTPSGLASPPIDRKSLVTPPAANGVVTPEIQAQLVAAINRGESAAILAFRTLNPSGLAGIYTGEILANLSAQIQAVARTGAYGVVQLHSQQFESFTLSPDGRKAEVRLTENWSANFHSVVTQACVSHFHQRDSSQTQFLELTPQGWVIYASKEDTGPQQLAACH